MLKQVQAAGAAGAFVFTFISPQLTHDPDPHLDLDMAGYGPVKGDRNRAGTTYPDLPWDPKRAVTTGASHYAEPRQPND